jgi:hypothetical protein
MELSIVSYAFETAADYNYLKKYKQNFKVLLLQVVVSPLICICLVIVATYTGTERSSSYAFTFS